MEMRVTRAESTKLETRNTENPRLLPKNGYFIIPAKLSGTPEPNEEEYWYKGRRIPGMQMSVDVDVESNECHDDNDEDEGDDDAGGAK